MTPVPITSRACSITAFSALRRDRRFIETSVSPMIATMKNSKAPSTHMWTTHHRQNSVTAMFVDGVNMKPATNSKVIEPPA